MRPLRLFAATQFSPSSHPPAEERGGLPTLSPQPLLLVRDFHHVPVLHPKIEVGSWVLEIHLVDRFAITPCHSDSGEIGRVQNHPVPVENVRKAEVSPRRALVIDLKRQLGDTSAFRTFSTGTG